ncbi:Lipid II:glycine glycyltransferase (Peptidoglycan interpeptide bridge formation enzyme) [Azospirillum oryzae]|uniref:Lipid II:glycine glycyltransferase (Peptidoglycan interpeptide bridge formation enzyme) n=1 Tax=Azospirillum oryzae TaxID=286727 RepID=A0A1X7HDJ3_9PROT|nr:GNAT family N-acetyltransferase [Azospirillum oryzae]SMF84524.1 Lipid II:glycine glycyltransferase (Peptidoglycan interpeptide bridge formation enzyme) [Azospirillum oryzae]
MPDIDIAWNEGTVGEWDALFARVPRSTLLQSFAYARAMGRTYGHVPRLGVIRRGGEPIGLVQTLDRRMLKLFHDRQCYRGPLWLDGTIPDADTLEAVFRLLRRACPRSPLGRANLLPELPAGPENEALLTRCGFRKVGPGYRTVWFDLTRNEEAMRAGFARDWRQRLRGAEKAGLVLDTDWKADNLPWLMKQEHDQALEKGFRAMTGPLAVRLRNAMVKGGSRNDGVVMVTALDGRAPVACGLFFRHGVCATGQISWANESGRKSGAMRLVLWKAMQELKHHGVRSLDLGGINPDTAPGVTEFKLGTGGEAVETVGQYR